MYRIGVDLGGTNIAVGVIDENYNIIGRGKVKTRAPRPAEAIFDSIKEAVDMAVVNAGINYDEIQSVGIGTPGSVNKDTGAIEFSNNLKFHNVPAKDMLEERLKKPVYLENDANAAALGEAVAGCGHGVKDFVAVTLGTGVGSGIIIDGKIYRGSNFCGGEMGHMVINVDGIPCNCGRKGCWEKYASATALVAQAVEAMQNDKSSLLWQTCDGDLNKVEGKTIFEALDMGDATAKAVVDRYLYYVAIGLANVINALQPEAVCIGGGISGQGEKILKPIRELVKAERYSVYADKQAAILPAALGNDAGIIGAALLDE
ncbi:MAG: ROK family protein [Clostridia bacterium]|nr:ROK family protein [Clostridia bacterium]